MYIFYSILCHLIPRNVAHWAFNLFLISDSFNFCFYRGGPLWMWLPRKVPKESRRSPTGTNEKIYPWLKKIWKGVRRRVFLLLLIRVCDVFIVAVLNKILLESMSKRIALLENKIVWGLTHHNFPVIYTHTHTVFTSCTSLKRDLCVWTLTSALFSELSQSRPLPPLLGLTSSTLSLMGNKGCHQDQRLLW